MAAGTVAALDIGGTKIAAALIGRDGGVVVRAEAPTPGRDGASAVLRTAADLVRALRGGADALTVTALGVGSAGVIDPGTGVVVTAPDVLSGWAGTDVRSALAAATGLPTTVVNDVHAHAVGEARHGAARGVGTALLVGVVVLGAHGAAGHLGHQPSPYATGRVCSCGGTGHLEAVAAGPALRQEYEGRGRSPVPDLRAVAARARGGDPVAADIITLGGAAIGSAIGGLINVFDPHVVVVGGGVSNLGRPWWAALRAAARREALPALAGVEVVAASLGGDAALVGAGELAWEVVS